MPSRADGPNQSRFLKVLIQLIESSSEEVGTYEELREELEDYEDLEVEELHNAIQIAYDMHSFAMRKLIDAQREKSDSATDKSELYRKYRRRVPGPLDKMLWEADKETLLNCIYHCMTQRWELQDELEKLKDEAASDFQSNKEADEQG